VHTGKIKEPSFEMQHGISHIAFTIQKSIPEWISLQQELIKCLKAIVLHASFSVVSFVMKPIIQFLQLRGGKQYNDLDKFGNVYATLDQCCWEMCL